MPSLRKCNRNRRKAKARPYRFKGWTLKWVSHTRRGRRRVVKVAHLELISISPPRIKTELGIHDLRLPEAAGDPFIIGPLTIEMNPLLDDLQRWSDWQDKVMREIYESVAGVNR